MSLVVKQIGHEQGLPQNSVNDFLQDNTGFIWVATDGGLARFDGKQFKVFDKKNGYQFTDSDSILSLYRDPQDELWLVTRANEIIHYDARHDQFTALTGLNQADEPLHSVHALLRQSDELWFVARGRLYHYHLKNQKLKLVLPERNPQLSSAGRWLIDDNQRIYLLSRTDLYRFQPGTGLLEKVLSGDDTYPLLLLKTKHQPIRIVTQQHLWCLTAEQPELCGTHTFDYDVLAKARTYTDIVGDQAGQYWLGVYSRGLYQLRSDLSVEQRHQAQQGVPYALPGNDISRLMLDQQQNLWAVPYGMGLAVVSPNARQIKRYHGGHSGLSHPHVQAIHQQNRQWLWVGTYNGLNKVNTQTGQIKSFLLTPGLSTRNNVRSILKYDDRHLLVLMSEATAGTPLWLFELATEQWRPVAVPSDVDPFLGGNAALRHQQKLWVSFVGSGLYELNIENQTWRRADSFAKDDRPDYIQSFYVDSQNRLWITDLFKGVYVCDLTLSVLLRIHQQSSPALAVNWARSVLEDSRGNFWIATNKGLHWLDKTFSHLEIYTTQQGLANDSIYGVLEDENADIWFSTNDGLHRFSQKLQQFQHFDLVDGLQGREFNTGAFLKGSQQELYFGGTNGLNQLWPLKIKPQDPQHSALMFTNLHLLNQQIQPGQPYQGFLLEQQIQYLEQLRLNHLQQIFTLDFATLNFLNPEKIRYRYRLSGLSEEWLETRQSSLTFSGLAAGDYLLQLQSTTASDWRSPISNQLAIQITPPWWQHRYAYLAYILLLLLAIVSLYWLRLTSLRRQTVLLQRAVDMRTAELKQALLEKDFVFNHVSHEFRTPLTLIDGAVAELEATLMTGSERPLLQVVRYQGRYLLRLVNQLLTGQAIAQTGFSATQPVAVSDLAIAVCEDFRILAQQKNIDLTAEVGEGLLVAGHIEDLMLIFNNLLSNAVKYTPEGGEIKVALTELPGQRLRIEVSDSGIGIDEAEQQHIWDYFYRAGNNLATHQGSGIGLALVKALVTKYQGQVSYQRRPGGGSIFQVGLPLQSTTGDVANAQIAELELKYQAQTTQLEMAILQQPPVAFTSRASKNTPAKTLLVVEDNLTLRQYLVAQLSADYRCLEATDGIAALVLLEQDTPDLIISDLMMPQMDGFTLCEKVKADIATSHIPFILLTASSDQQNKLRGLQHHANLYLNKPFDLTELKLYIENFLWQLARLKAQYQVETTLLSEESQRVSEHQQAPEPEPEQRFLQQLQQVLEQHYQQTDFQPANLAAALAVSERQLQRKLKALAQTTPGLYIRQFRLHKSRILLRQGHPAGYVAYSCGFTSQAYFTKCFKEAFAQTPGQFQQ